MTTKEVCELIGITPKALRVYESLQLVRADRSSNNYRNYSAEDTLRLRAISLLRELGFGLKEIRSILECSDISGDYLNMLYVQYRAIDSQIRNMSNCRDNLLKLINHQLKQSDNGRDIGSILNVHVSEDRSTTLLEKWDFDQMATNYFERFLLSDKEYTEVLGIMADLIKRIFKGGRAIDVGVGTGRLWMDAAPETNLTGLDKSLMMLRKCNERIPWAKFVLGDALMKNDDLGLFDLVVCTFTLHHIPYKDQKTAIDNLIAYCRQGGDILIADRDIWDDEGRKKFEQTLISTGRANRVQVINNEFYLYGSRICEHLKDMNLSFSVKRHGEASILFHIRK